MFEIDCVDGGKDYGEAETMEEIVLLCAGKSKRLIEFYGLNPTRCLKTPRCSQMLRHTQPKDACPSTQQACQIQKERKYRSRKG